VGLKTYLSHANTLCWFGRVAKLVRSGRSRGVTVLIMPPATALVALAPLARELGIHLGAQDCSRAPAGASTGELPAELLGEVGASFVELGHVERRRLGDTDEVIAEKARAAVAADLVPFVCAGEGRPTTPEDAARQVVDQVRAALRYVPDTFPVLLCYEPTWAIGAERPAAPEHVRAVARLIRTQLAERSGAVRVLYGGAAGPGLHHALTPDLDGLGLGRRAHDTEALGAVFDEMRVSDTATGVGAR
jgi:triosephosphate isomerase